MNLGVRTYGTVPGEKPAFVHRFGTIANRSSCGKAIVPLTKRERFSAVVCRRCIAIDEARRLNMPDPEWF